MRNAILGLALGMLAAGVLFWVQGRLAPAAGGARPEGPDLVPVFAQRNDRAEAAAHAHAFAVLCETFAAWLEQDGQAERPRIATWTAADEFRRELRKGQMRGWSFSVDYPKLPGVVEEYLAIAIGQRAADSRNELTPADRQRWVAAFRALAASADYAARQG